MKHTCYNSHISLDCMIWSTCTVNTLIQFLCKQIRVHVYIRKCFLSRRLCISTTQDKSMQTWQIRKTKWENTSCIYYPLIACYMNQLYTMTRNYAISRLPRVIPLTIISTSPKPVHVNNTCIYMYFHCQYHWECKFRLQNNLHGIKKVSHG